MEKYLLIAGSLPFIILGLIHLVYTFFSKKLTARDNKLNEEMKISFPVLTKDTTMWKSWIGFNASHSAGAIYFGLVNLLLAILYPSLLQNPLLQLINISTAFFYVWLAKKYWFRIPFIGMASSFFCFLLASFSNMLS
ncbi:MAG: hypothetical protein V4685_16645 [Bacteroidota bacterium]